MYLLLTIISFYIQLNGWKCGKLMTSNNNCLEIDAVLLGNFRNSLECANTAHT